MNGNSQSEALSTTRYSSATDEVAKSTVHHNEVQYTAPQNVAGSLALLMRLGVVWAFSVPVFCGAVLAWWAAKDYDFNVAAFVLCLGSTLCLLAGLNILSEYRDYQLLSQLVTKYEAVEKFFASANLIQAGVFNPNFVVSAGSMFILASLLHVMILVLTISGWPSLFFYGLTAFFLTIYLLPPSWHGYLSWGIGEIGIFIGGGIIPFFGSYYAQSHKISSLALWLAIPLGLLCVVVLYDQSLIRQRRNWLSRKRTLAVTLGDERAVNLSIGLVIASYIALLLVVMLTDLPLWLLLGLATLPLALENYKDTEKILHSSVTKYRLYLAQVRVTIYTGLISILMLVADKLL